MNKKVIRLTESDLHRIVKEAVNRILEHRFYYEHDDIAPDDVKQPETVYTCDICPHAGNLMICHNCPNFKIGWDIKDIKRR